MPDAETRAESPKSLLGAPTVSHAIQELLHRAERQPHVELLVATFVDPGAVGKSLDNDNNQILVGRRGTGKTHILRVLCTRRAGFTIYVDMRRVAQTPFVGEESLPAEIRVASVFQILLKEIRTRIAHYVDGLSGERRRNASAALAKFDAAITEISRADEKVAQEYDRAKTHSSQFGASANLSLQPGLNLSASRGVEGSESSKESLQGGRATARLLFSDVDRALTELMTASGIERLLVIVDEWSAIPYDLQPLFADYVNRALFNNPLVTAKIATVAYRSNFETPQDHNTRLGLEGGDDYSVVELDTHFVYKRYPDRVASFFAELLWRHLSVDAALAAWREDLRPRRGLRASLLGPGSLNPEQRENRVLDEVQRLFRESGQRFMDERAKEYMTTEFGISGPDELVEAMFTGRSSRSGTFHELVHASQGVVRDFIYILSKAYATAEERNSKRIDKESVSNAAEEWHSQGKRSKVPEKHDVIFRRVLDYILKNGDSDLFLLDGSLEKHEVIESLFDLRLIHLIQRGCAAADDPTIAYNQYAIDYGTYKQLVKFRPQDQRITPTVDARARYHDSEAPSPGIVVPSELITDSAPDG